MAPDVPVAHGPASSGGSPESRDQQRVLTALLVAGIVILAGMYVASIGPYWNISPDSATYVGWGRSLARGAGWRSTLFQPPVTSLLFAGVLFFFPDGYVALNALTPLLILIALGLAFLLLQREVGRNRALLLVLLSLATTRVYYASTQLLSEPAYMLISLAALFMLNGPSRTVAPLAMTASAPSRWSRELLTGALLILSAMTRTIGITLSIAVLFVEVAALLRSERRPRYVLAACAVLALASVAAWELYTGSGYVINWFRNFRAGPVVATGVGAVSAVGVPPRMLDHVGSVPLAGVMLLNELYTGSNKLDFLLRATATLVFVLGLLLALRRRQGVTELYVFCYAGVVMVHTLVGGDNDPRFMVPIVPLLFLYVFEAARGAFNALARVPATRALALPLRLAGGLYLVWFVTVGLRTMAPGIREAHTSPFGDYPIKRSTNYDAERLALFLRSISRPGDRYGAEQTDMYNVITERRGVPLPALEQMSPTDLFAWLSDERVRFFLIDRRLLANGDRLLERLRADTLRFRALAELPRASLFEVTSQPK